MYQALLIGGFIVIVLPYMMKMLPFLNPKHIYDANMHEKVPLAEINAQGHNRENQIQNRFGVSRVYQDLTPEQWDKIDWSKFDYTTINKTYKN